MDEPEAAKIIAEIEKRRMFDADEITSYLNSKYVESKSDMAKILRIAVVRRSTFWTIVYDCILGCASNTEEFYELVADLSKDGRILDCLEPLKELHAKDPETAAWLVERLEKSDCESVGVPLAYLYGGIGQSEPATFLGMMDKIRSDTQKVAYLSAIQFVYPNGNAPSRLADYVVTLSASCTPEIRRAAISCMSGDLIGFKIARDQLRRLAETGDGYKAAIARIPPRVIKQHKKFALELLEPCSKTENTEIQKDVADSLALCAPEHPLECIVVVKRWLKGMEPLYDRIDHVREEMEKGKMDRMPWPKDAVLLCGHIDHLLEEIGKGDLAKIRQFVGSWIRDAKDSKIDMVVLPYKLAVLYQKNETELVNLLDAVDCTEKRAKILTLSILKRFLDEGYPDTHRSEEFFEYAEKTVLGISEQLRIDARPNGELCKFMRLLDLIRQIERPEYTNIDDARNNLKRFKHLDRIVRTKELEKMIHDKHPLAVLLSMASPEPERRQGSGQDLKSARHARQQGCAYAMASNIDASLELFGDDKGTSRIRKGLASKTEFLDTVTELVVAARLKERFSVTLQPRVGDHVLDMEAAVCGASVFFEVFRPKEDIRLKYVEKTHGMGNEIRNKIVKKIDRQIKDALCTGCSVVLVIDCSDAWEIRDSDIVDSLFGAEVMKLRFENGVSAGPARPGRAKDSIYDKTPNARVISAVLLIRTSCDDMKMKISGGLFRAPNPAVPLDGKTEDAIKKSVFRST